MRRNRTDAAKPYGRGKTDTDATKLIRAYLAFNARNLKDTCNFYAKLWRRRSERDATDTNISKNGRFTRDLIRLLDYRKIRRLCERLMYYRQMAKLVSGFNQKNKGNHKIRSKPKLDRVSDVIRGRILTKMNDFLRKLYENDIKLTIKPSKMEAHRVSTSLQDESAITKIEKKLRIFGFSLEFWRI